jgi:SAM-dependent methyltransferase
VDVTPDWELIEHEPPAHEVLRLTFVPFFPDGHCAVVRAEDGFRLPTGDVAPGEDYLLDAALRIPLETAGFRRQTFHAFARDGGHVFAWCEGARYRGARPHAEVPLEIGEPDAIADRLRAAGSSELAEIVEAATRSYRSIDAETFHAESLHILERAYLRADTAEGGSGFGGSPEDWRAAREGITDGIDSDGTFIDLGCANGLLMESVQAWCAERGLHVEPYGVDIAPGLVQRARERLPQWSDRIWLGDASKWVHPEGMRFDVAHTLLDSVPKRRRRDLVQHLLDRVVRPGGRLLVSYYVRSAEHDRTAAEQLGDLGFAVAGQSRPRLDAPDAPPQTAWLVAP